MILAFPGQGSPRASLSLLSRLSASRLALPPPAHFGLATSSSSTSSWSTLSSELTKDDVERTETQQVVVVAAGVVAFDAWREQQQQQQREQQQTQTQSQRTASQRSSRRGQTQATAALGHSVGELAALVAVDAVDAVVAVELARRRGEAMARVRVELGSAFEPSMVAVMGLGEDGAREVEEEARRVGKRCRVGAFNGPKQQVLSGDVDGVRWGVARAVDVHGARRGVPLQVSAPFHTEWMEPAARELERVLRGVEIRTPSHPLVLSAAAAPTSPTLAVSDPADIKACLVRGVVEPVRFSELVNAAATLSLAQAQAHDDKNKAVVMTELGGDALTKTLRAAWASPPTTTSGVVILTPPDS